MCNYYLNTAATGYAGRLALSTVTSSYQCRLLCIRRLTCIGYNYNQVPGRAQKTVSLLVFVINKKNPIRIIALMAVFDLTTKSYTDMFNFCFEHSRVTHACELLSVSFRQPANVMLQNGTSQLWYTLNNAVNWETGARLGWIRASIRDDALFIR
jgi:hypothetical protein